MSRRRRNRNADIVDDVATLASRNGPVAALLTGLVCFIILYVLLPLAILRWVVARTAEAHGPLSTAVASLTSTLISHRFVEPFQWAGVAALLACTAIALWKLIYAGELAQSRVAFTSAVAKAIARLMG